MTKTLFKHSSHYISLIGVFVAAVIAFVFFSYDKLFLIGVSLAVCISYVSWGIIHHLVHKDLTVSVVIEYITISILGLVVTLSLIFRL